MYSGIAIALAWPETLCKQAGAWYDKPLKYLKINKGNYYKVGHAATVLINKENGGCHYFDFGRYHAPYGHGRVRSSYTDHDLEINTIARFNQKDELENLEEILTELYQNESCHGTGEIHASTISISFDKAFKKANEMQLISPIQYGPFVPKGTNCSRFVNTVLLAGKPSILKQIRLLFPITFSPTPIGNVKSLENYTIIGENSCDFQTGTANQCLLKEI